MATTKQTITAADGWVQIASDGEDFVVENLGPVPLKIHFGASPTAGSDYHSLPGMVGGNPSYLMFRVAPGDVHVACDLSTEIVHS